MKKNLPIILGIVICLIAVGISYLWATDLMASIYAYRSPLRDTPPIPGEGLGQLNTRSVVIVLIDALRYDTSNNASVMPFLNQLRSDGASALMHSRPPSYSEPGYTVILTGAWPDISDGPIINLDYADIPTFTQDDIFSATHRAGLLTAVSGFNWFEKLIPQNAVTTSFYTAGEDQVADREVVDAALPWLKEGKYNLVLIHIDQVDFAGHHEGGPIDPRWDAAATRADGLLKEIASAMDLNQDTLIIFSDHGQIDLGGHGGQDPIVLQEPFVMAGNGVMAGQYPDTQMADIAPTIAAILGTSIPATNEGHVLTSMFDFTSVQITNIDEALTAQQKLLVQSYQVAIKEPITVTQSEDIVKASQAGMSAALEKRLNSERFPRGILAVVLLFLILILVGRNAKPHLGWITAGVITYLVIFIAKYVLIDHRTFSLSSVASSTDLILSTAITTLIALLVGWLLFILGTRAYRLRPQQAAITTLKFILVLLAILSIPILVHYAVDGALVTWALPDFLISFLGTIFLIQTLIVGVIGIVLTGIAAFGGIFVRKNRIYGRSNAS